MCWSQWISWILINDPTRSAEIIVTLSAALAWVVTVDFWQHLVVVVGAKNLVLNVLLTGVRERLQDEASILEVLEDIGIRINVTVWIYNFLDHDCNFS
jgi:hypothetical protein